MAISEAKKVDYLWKKLGYGKTKTDIAGQDDGSGKFAANEAIASPANTAVDSEYFTCNVGFPLLKSSLSIQGRSS